MSTPYRPECDGEGHPLDPADSLKRPPPNKNWEFVLDQPAGDKTHGLLNTSPMIDKGDCQSCKGAVQDVRFDAIRLLLRMRDRLRRLEENRETVRAALERMPHDQQLQTELAYLDQMIPYKRSLVKSAQRVVDALEILQGRMPNGKREDPDAGD